MIDSPAARARQRTLPALSLPPLPPEPDRQRLIRELALVTSTGTVVPIGPNVIGDQPYRHSRKEASTLTITVRDVAGVVRAALVDQLQVVDGARVDVDDVIYIVTGFKGTKRLELRLVDEAAWRMSYFRSFRAFPRTRFTRAQAFRELVREAGSPPLTPLSAWIPELNDHQRVATAVEKVDGPTTAKGTGSNPSYKVKGEAATAAQRKVIDAILQECANEHAYKIVQECAIMTATQESAMGEVENATHLGPFNQDADYGSAATRRDPTTATRGFLKEWKRVHGSLRVAPKGKAQAIEAVQRSGQGELYKKWEDEAIDTVTEWKDAGGTATASAADPAEYEFTRGDRDGGRESSWTCSGRWAEEVVAWSRWAMLNTLCWASDDEMRAAAPVLHINGDEPWILDPGIEPDVDATRTVDEVAFDVLASRWALLPGAAVTLGDAVDEELQGRWLVDSVEGTLAGGKVTVTLDRPRKPGLEPAVDEASGGEDDSTASSALADKLYDACKQISDQGRPYLWGGGHGPSLSSILSTRGGLDCSSSVSLALWMAGMFTGSVAIVSGAFASSWGKPGKGKHFTVHANNGHVWIEFHGGNVDGHRFDTSPHGDGSNGPRLRTKPRNDQASFTSRRWTGQ